MARAVNVTGLHVVERGAGDVALVFLHYFGGSARAWAEVITRLADDYRCIAPDLRGFGDSVAPAAGITVSDYADDVVALTTTLGLKRYVLIGHSMGGKIALAVAARQPHGLAALILVAPSPPTPEPMTEDARASFLAAYGDCAAIERTIDKITARPLAPAPRAEVVADNLRAAHAAWRAWLERGSREDIAGQMPDVAVPVGIIAGAADPNFLPALLEREIVRRIRAAQLVAVENAGHLLPLEAPADVARLIRSYLHSFALAGLDK